MADCADASGDEFDHGERRRPFDPDEESPTMEDLLDELDGSSASSASR